MITAAPIIRKPVAILGHPGLTDFTSIYIASELNTGEYRTTLRHEQAHVWAGHNRRRPKLGDQGKWKIACEMEIARNIYDQEDIDTIKAPRSRLLGGYLPDSIDGLPVDIVLAEDIYEWLLAHLQELPESTSCGSKCSHESCDDPEDSISIVEARGKLDEKEKEQKSREAAKTVYAAILNRPPSLIECVDAALRYRIARESSYRRPSRRLSGDVLLKGKLSIPRPPLVEIFVDRSASFDAQKTSEAEQALASILSRYGASIRCDTWFFGNDALSSRDILGGGNTPYHLVADHIVLSHPKIAIIITDDDPVGCIQTPPSDTSVACIPIGCVHTNISGALKGKDVAVIR